MTGKFEADPYRPTYGDNLGRGWPDSRENEDYKQPQVLLNASEIEVSQSLEDNNSLDNGNFPSHPDIIYTQPGAVANIETKYKTDDLSGIDEPEVGANDTLTVTTVSVGAEPDNSPDVSAAKAETSEELAHENALSFIKQSYKLHDLPELPPAVAKAEVSYILRMHSEALKIRNDRAPEKGTKRPVVPYAKSGLISEADYDKLILLRCEGKSYQEVADELQIPNMTKDKVKQIASGATRLMKQSLRLAGTDADLAKGSPNSEVLEKLIQANESRPVDLSKLERHGDIYYVLDELLGYLEFSDGNPRSKYQKQALQYHLLSDGPYNTELQNIEMLSLIDEKVSSQSDRLSVSQQNDLRELLIEWLAPPKRAGQHIHVVGQHLQQAIDKFAKAYNGALIYFDEHGQPFTKNEQEAMGVLLGLRINGSRPIPNCMMIVGLARPSKDGTHITNPKAVVDTYKQSRDSAIRKIAGYLKLVSK